VGRGVLFVKYVSFQITAVYQLHPMLLKVRVLLASRGQLSDITIVYQAIEDKPNGFSVESGPGYLVSMSVCGAAQWFILSDSWPNLLHIT
jgi:hypothetical protein